MAIPFLLKLSEGKITSLEYAMFLKSQAIVWSTLEYQLRKFDHPVLIQLRKSVIVKLPLIGRDIKTLGAHEDDPSTIHLSLDIASSMLQRIAVVPLCLAGYLYAMEESLNSVSMITRNIEKTFTPLNVTRYFNAYADMGGHWQAFTDILDTIELSESESETICAATLDLSDQLIHLYESLSNINEKQHAKHITSINPEAGNHEMPKDPEEISSALRAGIQAWANYPYLKARFGERGLRFSKSDSCWLATLAHQPLDLCIKDILWVAGVLSVRGIPTIILEDHLVLLADDLIANIPENRKLYARLHEGASLLNQRRLSNCTEEEFRKKVSLLDNRIKDLQIFDFPIGAVIVSAQNDEANGYRDSLENIRQWSINSLPDQNRKGALNDLFTLL